MPIRNGTCKMAKVLCVFCKIFIKIQFSGLCGFKDKYHNFLLCGTEHGLSVLEHQTMVQVSGLFEAHVQLC